MNTAWLNCELSQEKAQISVNLLKTQSSSFSAPHMGQNRDSFIGQLYVMIEMLRLPFSVVLLIENVM